MLQRFFVCVVLIKCATGKLVEETSVQFIADYFAYKRIHVVTTFTCFSRGIYVSMGSLYRSQFRRDTPHLLAMQQNQDMLSIGSVPRISGSLGRINITERSANILNTEIKLLHVSNIW
jgi:hypothetical protein